MITDQTCTRYAKTSTKNAKGQVVNTYALAATFQANVQPLGLNRETAEKWGQTDLAANSRIAFTYSPALQMLDRVRDGFGNLYEVRGVNPWGSPPFGHYEALLIPVQGES